MSQWHFDSEFDEIEISSALKTLLKEQCAKEIDIFLQNSPSTIKSLDVQISGLYQTEIPLNLSVGKNPLFLTAPAVIFKDLGYSNTFYYGGSGTWQKLDTYTISQGFDRIYYNTHIIAHAKDKGRNPPYENSWGAYDHYLYDFIKDNINKSQKTFSMIMTTSNHPPHDVPLGQFEIPLDKIRSFVENNPKIKDKEFYTKIFAHIYYQDKMIAKFVREVSNEVPNSLFVITGDHYDRYYPFGAKVGVGDRVPLIIYAPSLKLQKIARVGSHIDITPSIVELVAPKGYKYMSFGKPLFSNLKRNSEREFALGYFAVANDRFLYDGYNVGYFGGVETSKDENLAKIEFENLKRAKALSWWIFKNGYVIKD